MYGPRPSRPENVPVGKSCIQSGTEPSCVVRSAVAWEDLKTLFMGPEYENMYTRRTLNKFRHEA